MSVDSPSGAVAGAVRRVSEVEVGQSLGSISVHIDRARLVQYAGASLDRNRIHWDERFATSIGLPDVIAHGMFTMGAAAELLADWVGDAGRVVEYGVRFTKPVPVPYQGGADLEVSGVVSSIDVEATRVAVDLTVTSGGQKVLGRAQAVLALD